MDLFETKIDKKKLPSGANLFLGTSGYSFPDWLNVFYPSRILKKDWLRYYALNFNSVEINSTYYRILSEKSIVGMVNAVPDNFSFSVKLHSSMTHSRDADKTKWKEYNRMLTPFTDSGKMGTILAQFPWSFPLEKKSFGYLSVVKENLPDMNIIAEFRHKKWYQKSVVKRVQEMGFGCASVDLPELSGLPGRELFKNSEIVYCRLHGRNKKEWWGNTQMRYDYQYSDEQLSVWAEKLRNLSGKVKSCYVFFNNCHMGKAALNAKDMERLMEG